MCPAVRLTANSLAPNPDRSIAAQLCYHGATLVHREHRRAAGRGHQPRCLQDRRGHRGAADRAARGGTFECSTFEGNGTTEDELRTCARTKDAQAAPAVTVDTKSVPVTEVETPLLNIVLPADNIFGLPAGTQGLSVAHGWVTLLHPLTPGTHTIFLDVAPTPITTKIVVQPDLKP